MKPSLLIGCCSILVLSVLLPLTGCTSGRPPTVVVYTSVDQPYSEPVLQAFEERTGIHVKAIYDTEATKTTGLVSRIAAERENPQADVFWSSEIAQTMWMTEQGLLESYVSPVATDIPAVYQDPHGYWTGIGLRARIILVNTDRVAAGRYPTSIYDLAGDEWQPREAGMASPLFGTAATHAAVLYGSLGHESARSYFEALRDQGVRIVDGNSVVRDMVASGDLSIGLTDTDDAAIAVREGKPVQIIFPDQAGMGTLLIPNTVALIRGGPNPDQGQELIDFLLSQEVETILIEADFLYASVRSVNDPDSAPVMGMDVIWADVAPHVEPAKANMQEIFLR